MKKSNLIIEMVFMISAYLILIVTICSGQNIVTGSSQHSTSVKESYGSAQTVQDSTVVKNNKNAQQQKSKTMVKKNNTKTHVKHTTTTKDTVR